MKKHSKYLWIETVSFPKKHLLLQRAKQKAHFANPIERKLESFAAQNLLEENRYDLYLLRLAA